jgi:hypothetical protein
MGCGRSQGQIGRRFASAASLQTVFSQCCPAAAAIDESNNSVELCKSGSCNEKSCSLSKLERAVLAVGWDAKPNAYWLIKNSWVNSSTESECQQTVWDLD